MGKSIEVFGFPEVLSAEAVKTFFEEITGPGSVHAAEVKQYKKGKKTYARVQFTSETSLRRIISMSENDYEGLYYESAQLRAKKTKVDVAPEPKLLLHRAECAALNFGCQTSSEKFTVLWKTTDSNVTVDFGVGLKYICFYFSFNSVEYKLQLSSQNIWQIVLHRAPRPESTKFLVFQLLGAPRIFYRLEENTVYSFFREIPDDQWVRTTDFTPFCCIGQSSGLCLEVPHTVPLPNLREYFLYYKEIRSQLTLEEGTPYCDSFPLVPIVHPPQGVELPYGILFKVNALVQNGCLPGPNLDADFFELVDPNRIEIRYVENALKKLYYLNECCYAPASWLKEEYEGYQSLKQLPETPNIKLGEGLAYFRRVQVTPCKVYFCGPDVNLSNRVLRNYPKDGENFLRVSFADEEWDKMYSADLSARGANGDESRRTEIYDRILSTLKSGIVIGDKEFEFLAYSSSQLRENSVWMFASRPGLTAEDIRKWMGDFYEIRNVAKYAARLGQSFSSSRETLSVGKDEIELIPDIETTDGTKYCFSDGIGKISADFAKKVAKKCGLRAATPSAFQIRYAGYKGVVAIDPCSSKKLSLRESMMKYESSNTQFDVLSWSKYHPCFLNRQIITLLSTLGISDYIFLKKQRDAVDQLNCILTDPSKAQEVLDLTSFGENTRILREMLKCGYKPDAEPFLSMMFQVHRASALLDMRTKSRIFIHEGRAMLGCLDETGTLEYGQVFVQYSAANHNKFSEYSSRSSNGNKFIHKGTVVVAKNPCLYPGDVRVLRAVDVPTLHHMVDCVVFPQKGERPHPNECSGSDLDGDMYFVCWDPELIPPKQIPPMDYAAAPSIQLDHDVTLEEVMEYFTNYILNDSLGIISNAHTVFADKDREQAMSPFCIELAKLFAIAVDFPKTGVPAVIPGRLRAKEYPDFMEKPERASYVSQRVIGKLFREVKDISEIDSIKSFTREMATKSYDPDMEANGFDNYIDEAFRYKTEYDLKLGNLMEDYGIQSEAEIVSGRVLKTSKSFDRRKDLEVITFAVKSLRKEARTWFGKKGKEGDDALAKASAWYHVTYHPAYWGRYNKGMNRDHFISFPWCVCDKLIQIKKSKPKPTPLETSSREEPPSQEARPSRVVLPSLFESKPKPTSPETSSREEPPSQEARPSRESFKSKPKPTPPETFSPEGLPSWFQLELMTPLETSSREEPPPQEARPSREELPSWFKLEFIRLVSILAEVTERKHNV